MGVATRSAKLLLGVSVAAILAAAFGGAQAQVASLPPPVASATDRNGVDLMSGTLSVPLPGISAGSNGSGISRVGSGYNLPYGDNFVGVINGASVTNAITVSLGGTSEKFNYISFNSGSQLYTYSSDSGTGNSLTCTTNTMNLCYYIGSDGTKATFDRTQTGNYAIQASLGAVTKIEKPDGEELNFYYRSYIANASPLVKFLQVHSVTSSLGWMVKYELSDSASWIVPTKIYIVNTSTDHCDPTTYGTGGADSCTVGSSWPTLNGSGGGGLVLDATGTTATTTVTTSTVNGRALVTGITTPTGISMSATLTGDKVTALTTSGQTWNYAYTDNSNIRTTTVTNPTGGTRVLVSDTSLGQVISDRDEEGRTIKYEYQNKRIYRIINPDATYTSGTLTGGYAEYEYDARGNVTKTTIVPKDAIAGTTKSLVATASYPANCPASDLKFCNQPTSVTDVNGLTTTYEYDTPVGGDPNTGSYMVKKVTLPAVDNPGTLPDGTPEIRYSYRKITPRHYEKPGSLGTLTADTPVWRLVEVSTCMVGTAPTCVGTADEARTTISYGADNTNPTYKNVLPATITRSTGNGSNSLTVTYGYDSMGRVISTDGPLSGANDTEYTFFNRAGWVIGTIGADPDGAGALKRKSLKYTYNSDGKITKQESGVASGIALSDLPSGTNVYETAETEYDSSTGLAKFQRYYAKGSATPQKVTRTVYDSLFRIDCVTVASSDPQACAVAGGATPERITKYNYNKAGQVLSTVSGYGTSLARQDFVNSYNAIGTVATVADDKGNLTTYSYDKFNRLVKTCYPNASTPYQSSTSDCSEVEYSTVNTADANRASNRPSSVNLRDGDASNVLARLSLTYDVLGRLKTRVGPVGSSVNEAIYYNNFGWIVQRVGNGVTSNYSYHSLFGMTSESQPTGNVRYSYDGVGRRERVYYDDSNAFYVTYAYRSDDSLSTISSVYNSGSPVVRATFAVDDYGRLDSLSLGPSNQAILDPVFDTASRVSTLTSNVSGTADDVVWTYGYNNATNSITSRTSSNSAYNYVPSNVASLNYGHNGLNQMTAAGANAYTYDVRGNLATGGGATFSYNLDSLLTSYQDAAMTSTLTYDAQSRLSTVAQTVLSTTTTRKFLYAGSKIIAEFDNSNNLLRRYIHGPAEDQPLVWFEGANDSTPQYFLTDQQGSITTLTNSSGGKIATYTYDSYGVPQTTGSPESRFRYTGQTYLPEVGGLYYYKARMYQPAIGRFLQPDPTGYADGINLYAYVKNNPINATDPTGLECAPAMEAYYWVFVDKDGRFQGYVPDKAPVYMPSMNSSACNGQPTTPAGPPPGYNPGGSGGQMGAPGPKKGGLSQDALCKAAAFDPKKKPDNLPAGFKEYSGGDGSTNIFMTGPDGKQYPTPDYQNSGRVSGSFDFGKWGSMIYWQGVARDLTTIVIGSLSGGVGNSNNAAIVGAQISATGTVAGGADQMFPKNVPTCYKQTLMNGALIK